VRRVTAPLFARVPLGSWPSAVGAVHDISVPARVRGYAAPTAASPANINILLALLEASLPAAGAVAECGVFRGSTLIAMALYLKQHKLPRTVYGFDSFEGFGATIRGDLNFERTQIDPNMTETSFSDTSVEIVAGKARLFGLRNVELIKGFFETSLARCPEERFAFVHLDCDTYVGYRDCLLHFYPRLSPGATVVFDEYDDPAWPGCNKAVEEFLADKPEKRQEMCRDNFVKSYFVKQ
jgi:O-methyltransferase